MDNAVEEASQIGGSGLREQSQLLFGDADRLEVALAVARSDHDVVDVVDVREDLYGWPNGRVLAQLNALARAGLLQAVPADDAAASRYARKPARFWDACIELDERRNGDRDSDKTEEPDGVRHQTLEHVWLRVTAQLRRVVDDTTYRVWLEPLRAVELSESRLLLEAPQVSTQWIRDRFGHVIQSCAELVLGPNATVEFATPNREHTVAPARADQPAARVSSPPARGHPARLPPSVLSGPTGNPKLTFDQFVVGDSNRLAHSAALTVAEMPAQAYNPLVIFGPPGVGKTHLLSSIASVLLVRKPDFVVRLVTGESYTNGFLAALHEGELESFRRSFRDVNVLLIDDIQFLKRKTKSEQDFFHTFIALQDAGCQIVLTCDRSPDDLQAIEDRLRARMVSGLVAEIMPPDFELRKAIVRERLHRDGPGYVGDEAIDLIAERVHSNVRALEGALIRVIAFSSLTGRPFTAELAREVLDSLYPAARTDQGPTVRQIQEAVSDEFGITVDELLSTTRSARVVWPRHVAMFLARELTSESLPSIGRHFGGRDHTTVLHAWRRATARITSDQAADEVIDRLRRALAQPASSREETHGSLSALPEAGKA